jgi:hypothetical protein
MIKSLTQLFNLSGAKWAFAREPEIIQRDVLKGEEIDVWCESKGLYAVSRILLQNGWHLVSGRRLGHPNDPWSNTHLRFRNHSKFFPELDVASGALRWWLISYLDQPAVFKNILPVDGVPYLTGSAILSILITRTALRGELEGERLHRARQAYRQASPEALEEWHQKCVDLIGWRLTMFLEKYLQTGEVPLRSSYRLIVLIRSLKSQKAYSRVWWKHAFQQALNQLILPWRRKMGGIFCIVGTDGTGKTTLAIKISDALKRNNLNAIYFYMGRAKGNTAIVNTIRSAVFRLSDLKPSPSRSAPIPGQKSINRHSRFLFNLGAILYWIEYWCRHLFILRLGNLRSHIYIVDRGAFDLLVMPGLWSSVQRFMSFLPLPEGLIFCNAPPDEIYRRKQERQLFEIKSHQNTYYNIYLNLRGRIPVLHLTTIKRFHESNLQLSIGMVISALNTKRGLVDHGILNEI